MGQISVILINVTITRRVLSRAFLLLCKKLYCFPSVFVLCGKLEIYLASFIISFFCGNMVSLFFSQCRPHHYLSALFAEVSFAHLEPLNANGQSLFLLCSTCHLMCHFDWQTNGGPICNCCLPEHSVQKDIHQKLYARFLVSLSYYLYSTVRGAVKLIMLYFKEMHD